MCYNAEISFDTFLYGTLSLIIVLALNKVPLHTIAIAYTISLIQLMEYFAWKNIDNSINLYYISHFGFIIIFIQIFIINYYNLKGQEKQIITIILLLLLPLVYYNISINNKFKIEKGENGHLIWWWLDILYPFNILILLFYIYPYVRNKSYFDLFISYISLYISLYYFYKYKTWGSMWCYIGNFLWIILIIKSIYLYI